MISTEHSAGFFDGEGCVAIVPKRHTYKLQVRVSQNDPAVPHMFKDRWGGSITEYAQQGQRNRNWVWVAENASAAQFLEDVLPYLIVKRQQAELALEFRALCVGANALPKGRHVHRLPEKRQRILAARGRCYEQMKQFNSGRRVVGPSTWAALHRAAK
jgi:hypothetical protein